MILDAAPEVEVAGEAVDGASAVEEARRLRPDVVLMDVRMPGLDGIEATRRIVALDGPPCAC
jgi:chemotaxis response regulator CheB